MKLCLAALEYALKLGYMVRAFLSFELYFSCNVNMIFRTAEEDSDAVSKRYGSVSFYAFATVFG